MIDKKESRMKFDTQGRLVGIDNVDIPIERNNEKNNFLDAFDLKKSEDLGFLKEDNEINEEKGELGWGLYENGKKLPPLIYSDSRTQESISKEIVNLIKQGKKLIFLHGVCGSGKSALALDIARELGRASIVVPVKALQRQYEEDYMGKKYVIKKDGKRMKIAMITGRENHDSIIEPGVSCADPFLPDTIVFSEKNSDLLTKYYNENPFIKNKVYDIDVRNLKRLSVAPANPYWSPILPADVEIKQLKDATLKRYTGLNNREFIFYHRKRGCSYFDQYQAYIGADVLIFNSAKYKIECALDRKPATNVEIIDEGDEFLDSFSTQEEINLTRLNNSLKLLVPDFAETDEVIDKICELIKLEEKNKRAVGVREDMIYKLEDTKIQKILECFLNCTHLQSEIVLDELNYSNHALEVARAFEGLLSDSYASYKYKEDNLIVELVSTNLSKQFKSILNKNKALVLMSGTIHSEKVIKEVFGIDDFVIVKAETALPGKVEVVRSGKEFDCKYANFIEGKHTREEYLSALDSCLEKAKKPILVQVNAFEDLPSEEEINKFLLKNLISKEKLIKMQSSDKTGRAISLFKEKQMDVLFSTKCARGVDFPGDICNSVIFTKYPNPSARDIFWKVFKQTKPVIFWTFYNDKARREFLQRLYRAVRSKDDYVYVLSPDERVLNFVNSMSVGNR